MDHKVMERKVMDYKEIGDSVRHYIDEHELLEKHYSLYIKSYESSRGAYSALVLTNKPSDKRIYKVIHTTRPKVTTVTSYLQENDPISYNK